MMDTRQVFKMVDGASEGLLFISAPYFGSFCSMAESVTVESSCGNASLTHCLKLNSPTNIGSVGFFLVKISRTTIPKL